MPADSEFAHTCAEAGQILSAAVGYFVERIDLAVWGDSDRLAVMLRHGPDRPDLAIELAGLRHLAMSKPPEASGSFIDEVDVTFLPSDGTWPADAERLVSRHEGMPDLVRVRLVGPTELDAVAATITVFVEHRRS